MAGFQAPRGGWFWALNDTPVFQKTLALNDFYFRSVDWAYPLGEIQLLGKTDGDVIKGELSRWESWTPTMALGVMARHSIEASVFGSGFSSGTYTSVAPFPATLGGENVIVTVNGKAAPVFFASPSQINFRFRGKPQSVRPA